MSPKSDAKALTKKIETFSCYNCDAVCHSKKQLNRHHKSEHAKIKCPDCNRQFPTADSLQRHQYTHRHDHQINCSMCEEVFAFTSNLVNHMEKHKDERPWKCPEEGCTRDFKRKSDLMAHEVVHRGEYFICEFPNCDYKNVDPRLVKRHQRVHTQEKKVKCTECNKRFVFYQQMKRHQKSDHGIWDYRTTLKDRWVVTSNSEMRKSSKTTSKDFEWSFLSTTII